MPNYQEKQRRSSHTAAERAAFNQGVGYATAKAGERVPITPGEKQSFRAGVNSVRRKNSGKKGK